MNKDELLGPLTDLVGDELPRRGQAVRGSMARSPRTHAVCADLVEIEDPATGERLTEQLVAAGHAIRVG